MVRAAPNLGPRAAAGNRAALLGAARDVFAESGITAPLYAVARRAGVGQGSLYRHFPDRLSLVAAIFGQNVADLEERAKDAGLDLAGVLGILTNQAIESVAMVDLIVHGPPDERLVGLQRRVAEVLASRLPAAAAAGEVRPGTSVEDMLLGIRMVAGALVRTDPALRPRLAQRAWRLLGIRVTGVGRDDER